MKEMKKSNKPDNSEEFGYCVHIQFEFIFKAT